MSEKKHYTEFRTQDLEPVFNFVAQYPFAVIAMNDPAAGVPAIVQTPVLLSQDGREVEFHIARGNAAHGVFAEGGLANLVFSGPNAHISPGWYKDRFAGGDRSRTAPTWDYMTVHMTAALTPMDDAALEKHLSRLVAQFEEPLADGWRFEEIEPSFLGKLKKYIQGFTGTVEQAEGIFKLSQEQKEADRMHIIEGLRKRSAGYDEALAAAIKRGLE